MIFINHNLAVIRNICDRVAVIYPGKIVLLAPGQKLLDGEVLSGEPPSLFDPPGGCRFQTRCHRATARCAPEAPRLTPSESGHLTACHHRVGVA
jgi:oligopeptide/dipeptide ABC transporter ATP-binding protein